MRAAGCICSSGPTEIGERGRASARGSEREPGILLLRVIESVRAHTHRVRRALCTAIRTARRYSVPYSAPIRIYDRFLPSPGECMATGSRRAGERQLHAASLNNR